MDQTTIALATLGVTVICGIIAFLAWRRPKDNAKNVTARDRSIASGGDTNISIGREKD